MNPGRQNKRRSHSHLLCRQISHASSRVAPTARAQLRPPLRQPAPASPAQRRSAPLSPAHRRSAPLSPSPSLPACLFGLPHCQPVGCDDAHHRPRLQSSHRRHSMIVRAWKLDWNKTAFMDIAVVMVASRISPASRISHLASRISHPRMHPANLTYKRKHSPKRHIGVSTGRRLQNVVVALYHVGKLVQIKAQTFYSGSRGLCEWLPVWISIVHD
jgi:hypothetical protein